MSLSIRARLVLAINLLVIGVGIAVGWAGMAVSGRVIEQRLVDEAARNAASIFGTMQLPFSDTMLVRLRQILGAEVAAGPLNRPQIAATSLPQAEAQALQSRIAEGPLPRTLDLAGSTYLVGSAEVAPPDPAPTPPDRMCLYLLVPASQVAAAKQAAQRTLTWVTAAAIVVATLLAFWLSATILRPVRRLTVRMDALGERAAEERLSVGADAAAEAGPAEIVRLARSFDRLLTRLEEARRELARSARLATLGQLAASVVHELRNPLSGIQMNAQVLAEELAKAGVHDSSLERIVQEADRMNLYLEELLELAGGDARYESPHDLAALPEMRLEEVAESVLAPLERRCQHAGVRIERRWQTTPCTVRAREAPVRQVILNLVLNALDAMPAGGLMTVSTRPGDGGTVRFSVADTGRGVHVAEGTDVFDPFVTTKPAGVGLGLYVCRRNVARHGGKIGYDSSDEGTTFWFELPAAH